MMKLGIGVLCVWWLFQSRDLAANLTVANTNDSGPGSLRQAILDANNNPGEDLIQFCIPGSGPHSIRPGSALPEITEAVTIDGYTQPGAAPNTLPAGDNAVLRIRLDGSAAGGGVGGLTINSDRTVIRGLMIGGFGYSPSGVAGDGIRIIGGSSNRVEGCFIGIDTDGATLMPNWASGVHLLSSNAWGNLIGGTTAAARNILSGQLEDIQIDGSAGNLIQGNFIGLDATGTRAAGDYYIGILVASNSATGNVIGGVEPGARNVISGKSVGVMLEGCTASVVQGNFLGTDATGTLALSNADAGIWLTGSAASNLIGGSLSGAGNLVSGNGWGILCTDGRGEQGNVIQGNLIGTDIRGTKLLGNTLAGVASDSSYRLLIGGTIPGAGNVISGNGYSGVFLNSPGSFPSVIQGNFIGTDRSGHLAIGNSEQGIELVSYSNLVGGTLLGSGNIIAFNRLSGVLAEGDHISVLGNSIFSNGLLGIDTGLVGVSTNDPYFGDFQSMPWLSSAVVGQITTVISGTLNSQSSSSYRIEFFDNEACDPSGYGEGQTFLGFTNVMTDAGGNGDVTFVYPGLLPAGHYVTATATGTNNTTSEFSACQVVEAFNTIDLALIQSGPTDWISLSSNAVYNITITNRGPTNATGVVVTDTLPGALNFVSASASQGDCHYTANIVTCELGTITNGGFATISVAARASFPGCFMTRAVATANEFDWDSTNNEADALTCFGIADVAVSMVASPDPVVAGQLLTFQMAVTNLGPDTASAVGLQAAFDTNFVVVAAFPSQGEGGGIPQGFCFGPPCVDGSCAVTYCVSAQFGSLPPGATAALTVIGRPMIAGTLTTTAKLLPDYQGNGMDTSDPNPQNDVVVTQTTVVDGPGILSFDRAAYQVSENAGSALITVIRTGGSIGEVTVAYATSNSTAIAGNDYVATAGTLVFTDGQTSQTFTVPLLANSAAPCNKTLNLLLLNPGKGAVLVRQTNAPLTIFKSQVIGGGILEAVSVGYQDPALTADWFSISPSISGDGRLVAFASYAADLVTNQDGSFSLQAFVRDLEDQRTVLASVNRFGTNGGNGQSFAPVLSADGRFVAFRSSADDLVTTQTNAQFGVFVRDLETQTTLLVSANAANTANGNGWSDAYSISSNGMVIAFESQATDLVDPPLTNTDPQVFARDLSNGSTTLVSVNTNGTAGGNVGFSFPVVSAGGRYVAFSSSASDLVANDTNGFSDVFVRDLETHTTSLVSVNKNGTSSGNSYSFGQLAITPDGRYVAFISQASDLTENGTEPGGGVFIRDMVIGTTRRVSGAEPGMAANGSYSVAPTISANGRYIAYEKHNGFFVEGAVFSDVFVRDILANSTLLASVNCSGTGGGNGASSNPVISSDGRYVFFESQASDLVAGEFVPGKQNVFRRDLASQITVLVSADRTLTSAGNDSSSALAISADGTAVAFQSPASNLVFGDQNGTDDVFVWRAGPPPPRLSVTLSNNVVILAWPSPSTRFQLETAESLGPLASWSGVTSTVADDGVWKSVLWTNQFGHRVQAFRLRRQ